MDISISVALIAVLLFLNTIFLVGFIDKRFQGVFRSAEIF